MPAWSLEDPSDPVHTRFGSQAALQARTSRSWAFYRSIKATWYDRILEVKRTRDTEADDGAQLELWRCKKHDLSDFPALAEGSFSNVYGEKLEEYDKQAVLAISACTGAIVCALMGSLVNRESQYCLMVSREHR